ncbi:aquaporin-like [Cydia pomonella]|uniref:aquaporin-like n=1 Tax=Cydia pomonella TaxID=82600 RepID=UPI002ADE44DB|nr:aquaporin-like [Cydia pomonella]
MDILKAIGLHEFKNWDILRRLLSELIGTFLLITISLSGIHEIKSAVGFALANGLLLASIIAYTGHISGGHVNPAVTLGMLICNYIKLVPALCYVVVQIVGALLGQMVARWIVMKDYKRISSRKMGDRWGMERSEFGLEVLETFLLVSVALSVTDPRRSARGVGSAGLAIGLSAAASHCAVTEYKASLNPVGHLATSIYLKSSTNWVYWGGPMLGGLLAGLVYRFILSYSRPASIQVIYRP